MIILAIFKSALSALHLIIGSILKIQLSTFGNINSNLILRITSKHLRGDAFF